MASDGNLDYARKSAFTAMAFYGVGSALTFEKMSTTAQAFKVAAHGAVGGVSSVANGGTFESGFISAGLSEVMSGFGGYDAIGNSLGVDPNGLTYSSVASAIVGGTTSEISGGTFESGATSAAFGRLFNELSHRLENRGGVINAATYEVIDVELCSVDGYHGIIQTETLLSRTPLYEAGIESDYSIESVLSLGSLVRTGAAAMANRGSSAMVSVTRWGRPGLEPGDWVMKGGRTWGNYLASGKLQPRWMPGGNSPVAFEGGSTYLVPRSSVRFPIHEGGKLNPLNYVKYGIGQRTYLP